MKKLHNTWGDSQLLTALLTQKSISGEAKPKDLYITLSYIFNQLKRDKQGPSREYSMELTAKPSNELGS